MSIDEQLNELLGQKVTLTLICLGDLVEDDPIIGTLQRLDNGDYLVNRWQFSSQYVESVQGAKIVFSCDRQGEDDDPNDYDGPWYDDSLEDNIRAGEAHMAELRKWGWDG